jgi:hypothetical protein
LECGGLTPLSQFAISDILLFKAASSRRTPRRALRASQQNGGVFAFILNLIKGVCINCKEALHQS